MKKILLPILLIAIIGFSRTAGTSQQYRNEEIKIHNINQVEMCISNFGKFGQTKNQEAGCWWPKGSNENYIFGAGTWFGTIVDGDTLVTIGYGPHGAETEYVPGDEDMSKSDPNAVIFMYPTNWPPPENGFSTVVPPQKNKSHQDSWCVYNDLDESAHIPGDTRPIGLVVYQTVYAWNLSSTQDIIFIKFELRNVSGADLTDCYFGVCTDNDIGNEAGTGNDIISGIVGQWYVIDGESLWVDNLGYQWQTESEPGWSNFPGTIGFDYLQSPWDLQPGQDKDNDGIPDEYERDSSYYVNNLPDSLWDVDLDGTPDWRDPSEIPQLGMTAFKRFTLNLEPNRDNERYVTLAGYNFKTGVYEPFDTVPPQPDDQRFLQCSGPFELMADSVATVLVGIIFARWDSTDARPDTGLVPVDNTCQFIYDMNWLLPGPPSPPTLTCVPGDAQVTLVWNSAPEYEPDPYYDVVGTDPTSPLYDPYYKQYDFEGYRVWRSLTGESGDWEKLAYCDKFNGIVFEDTTSIPDDTLLATDTGIFHSYVDTDVRNGFTYYYAVTSFDYNMVKDDDTLGPGYKVLKFESGKVGVTAAPRRDPVDFVPGSATVEVLSGNDSLLSNISVAITYPLDMSEAVQYLEFGDIGWQYIVLYDDSGMVSDTVVAPEFVGYLEDSARQAVDSVRVVLPLWDCNVPHSFSMYDGMNIGVSFVRDSLPTDVSIFDTIIVESGAYPDSLLKPSLPGPWASYFAFWAYRGNDYEVEWYNTSGASSGDANTVRVIDLMTGDTIGFSPYDPEASGAYDTLASGWCFQSHLEVSDTLVLNGTPPATRNTKFLYINGGLVGLNKGAFMQSGGPVPQVGEKWRVVANPDFPPVFVNALFQITPVPGYFDTVAVEQMNVKVVPNPYLIHNEWQQSFASRRLKFINLPGDCTIRIFNLNGELVKTIKHHHTYAPDEETGYQVKNNAGGDEWWDLLSENRQLVASGVYIFHVQSDVGEQVGKFVVIR